MNKQLYIDGIKLLQSYVDTAQEKSNIDTKFKNISGKTGQYYVPNDLFQKRTSRCNRCLIPFEHVIKNNLTYEQLNTVENGIVVEFVNDDYFNELEKPENEQSEIFKKLKDKLGSDDNVSAIIDIRSTGDSSSDIQRKAYAKLINYIDKSNLSLKDCLIKRKAPKIKGVGNDKWEGFVYFNIKGGQQDSLYSHENHNEILNLFNPAIEYADNETALDISLVLIYFAMFSIPKHSRDNNWDTMINSYEEYFKTKIYDETDLFSYVSNHISLNLEKGQLIDPIQVKPIDIRDFAISYKTKNINAIDLTHQEAVNKHSYIFDEKNNRLLSPARPTNVFWSTHLSNMMQQDFSLKEYFQHQLDNVKKWKKYGIDKL